MTGICPILSGIDLEGKLVEITCIEHRCKKYVNVTGENPQTGEILNQWDCADTWVPILMIENSKQQRGTSAAIESLRNEVVKGNKSINPMLNLLNSNPTRSIGN